MSESAPQSPYPRENFWGASDQPQHQSGHRECPGTDPAEYLAFTHLKAVSTPVCDRQKNDPAWNGGRTAELFAWLFDDECVDGRGDQLHRSCEEVELTEPALYVPKQHDVAGGRINYRQHRLRRRYNPETGYINFGETTATAVPDADERVYRRAVANYLRERGIRLGSGTAWEQYAMQLYRDQDLAPEEALEIIIRKKRALDDPQNTDVTEVPK